MLTKILVVGFAIGTLALNFVFQKATKPYQEWSEKEIDKMLDNSAWGRTQVDTDTSEMFFRPDGNISSNGSNTTPDRTANGQTNQATSVNYRVRFLSARPIREALVRKIQTQQKEPNPQLAAQLEQFLNRDFADYIVVAVTFDTKDPRFRNAPAQAFAAAVPATLKPTTYLDRNDGKRLFLMDYKPPANDGLGAKFIFPRTLDGQPFLSSDFTQVRFYSELTSSKPTTSQTSRDAKQIKIDVRFKVSEMQYNGRLEY